MATPRTGNPPGRPPHRGDVMMMAHRFPIDHADQLKILSVETGWTQTDLLCKGVELATSFFGKKLPEGFEVIDSLRSARPILPSERLELRRAAEAEERKKKTRRKR